MAYVHNWALFLCVGLAVATALFVRERLRDFLYVALGVFVLYLPWLPTLLAQAEPPARPGQTARTSTTSSSHPARCSRVMRR